jgi:hypothetical protein
VDRLLWRTDERLIPDAAAISLVADAAMAGLAGPLDLGAALVLIQAGRLRLDGLQHEIGCRAEEYRQAAVSYREMAARYGKLADGSG